MAPSSDLEARVARLERYVVSIADLSQYDDPDQAAARAKEREQNQKDAEKAAADAAKAEEKAAAEAGA